MCMLQSSPRYLYFPANATVLFFSLLMDTGVASGTTFMNSMVINTGTQVSAGYMLKGGKAGSGGRSFVRVWGSFVTGTVLAPTALVCSRSWSRQFSLPIFRDAHHIPSCHTSLLSVLGTGYTYCYHRTFAWVLSRTNTFFPP